MLELEVKNLNKKFGGLHVLKDVTFGIKLDQYSIKQEDLEQTLHHFITLLLRKKF